MTTLATWADGVGAGVAMPDRSGGVTMLDGAALVIGAAVASTQVRGVFPDRLTGAGWSLVWWTFAGITVSAAGPFVFLARRYWRRPPRYPRTGDLLWTILGLPWVLTAPLRTAQPLPGAQPDPFATLALTLGIAAASLVALVVIWKTWVLASPVPPADPEPPDWTDRVGLTLASAFPLQWGFGLVVLG